MIPIDEANPDHREEPVDVLVVGAGFSGLSAARRLHRQGWRVRVLEARERVGGRVRAGRIAGLSIDLGGMWVGPAQGHLLALAEEFGLARYAQPLAGRHLIELGSQLGGAEGEDFLQARAPAAREAYLELLGRLEALSADLPAGAHWQGPRAAEFDALTVAHWLDRIGASPEARSDLAIACRALLCAEIHQLSLLHFLFYLRSGGGFAALTSVNGGAQQWLFRDGLWQLSARLAASLPAGTVQLEQAVRSVEHGPGAVRVGTDRGLHRARALLMAVPPMLAGRVDYRPPLDARRDGLMQRLPMGSVIKCYLAYARPFWREAGLNGLVLSDSAVFSPIFDVSPPDQPLGLLCGFIDGEAASRWSALGAQRRREQFIAEAERWFGMAASDPLDYADHDWTCEAWSRGCYAGYAAPGTWATYGAALRQPEPPLFWAGTETATQWYGYIDGALSAGQRAADEVHAYLQTPA